MYNPSYDYTTPQGWECPRCHRIYSPTQYMCPYCGGNSQIIWSDRTDTPTHKYEDNLTTGGSIYDNGQFKSYSLYDKLVEALEECEKGHRWRSTND